MALTLERDAALGERLAGAAPTETLGKRAIGLRRGGPFIHLSSSGRVCGVGLTVPDEAVDLPALLAQRADLRAALTSSIQENRADTEAERLLDAILYGSEAVTREDFAALARWNEVLAPAAYGHATTAAAMLDQLHAFMAQAVTLPDQQADPLLRTYWTLIQGMGHVTMIATCPANHPLTMMQQAAVSQRWGTSP